MDEVEEVEVEVEVEEGGVMGEVEDGAAGGVSHRVLDEDRDAVCGV